MNDARRNGRRRVLQVESLESLTLLSGLAPPTLAPAVPAALGTVQAAARSVALNATTRGSYAFVQGNPDTGKAYYFVTAGWVPGLGYSTFSGSIHTPGFIRTGTAAGTMTVYTPRGTLTLQLTSDPVPGFSDLPTRVHWAITGGTNQLKGATGSGTLDIALRPTWGFGGPRSRGGGLATLTFHTA